MSYYTTVINDDIYVEIEYESWVETPSGDYDTPPNEGGYDILQITLHIGKQSFNLVAECDEISDALNWDKINEAIEEEIKNNY